ncbi:MAG: four helix bundle protein [Lewinellaceae bacterium]|nr:four helix bundle protein [Lewinellaceae bacterium]
MKNHVPLDDLEIFQLAMEIGAIVWDWVANWNGLAQKTVGEQFVRAADSIAANIA